MTPTNEHSDPLDDRNKSTADMRNLIENQLLAISIIEATINEDEETIKTVLNTVLPADLMSGLISISVTTISLLSSGVEKSRKDLLALLRSSTIAYGNYLENDI